MVLLLALYDRLPENSITGFSKPSPIAFSPRDGPAAPRDYLVLLSHGLAY